MLYLGNNQKIMDVLYHEGKRFTAVYADCIYENLDFSWIDLCYDLLIPNGVIFIQTDYHSVYKMKIYMDKLFGNFNFINHLIYMQEWGGTSKRSFPKKHDDILFYAKSLDYKFYPDRIQIPKVTAGTALDKKGTGLKTPCDVFYDLGNFSTISKERVKGKDTKNVRWQKPLKLIERLLLPTTDEGDSVLDPFCGTGTTAVWCEQNNREYVCIDNDIEMIRLTTERLNDC